MKESQERTESKKHLERYGKIITLLGNRSSKQEEFEFFWKCAGIFFKQDLGCLTAQGHSETTTVVGSCQGCCETAQRHGVVFIKVTKMECLALPDSLLDLADRC